MVIEFDNDEDLAPRFPRWLILIAVLVAVVVVAVVLTCALRMERTMLLVADSDTMYPTILAEETVLVDLRPDQTIAVDAVVAVRFEDQGMVSLKRVIALGGQVARWSNGVLSVAEHPLTQRPPREEDFSMGQHPWRALERPDREVRIPEGQYFVIGDNWGVGLSSFDSGPVSRDQIVGVVRKVVWPIIRRRTVE